MLDPVKLLQIANLGFLYALYYFIQSGSIGRRFMNKVRPRTPPDELSISDHVVRSIWIELWSQLRASVQAS